MEYRQFLPSQPLREYIACYWSVSFEDFDFQNDVDLVLPDGSIDLVINFGEDLKQKNKVSGYESRIKDFGLVGQRMGSMEIVKNGYIEIFAIRFKPYGLQALFNMNCAELTGFVSDENSIKKKVADKLLQLLSKVGICDEVIPQVDATISRVLNPLAQVRPYVKRAAQKIVAQKGIFSVSDFCKGYGIHKSTLEKAFLFQTGISPKEYASIVRFNELYSRVSPEVSFAQLALECGYYDQSHMIRDFKKYSGFCPTTLMSSGYQVPEIIRYFNMARSQYCQSN